MKTTKGRKVGLASATALLLLIPVVWNYWSEILFSMNFARLGRNEQGYPEYRHRQTGIVFVSLPGGTFLMGSPEDEKYRDKDDEPLHAVRLSPFLIAKYEVTQGQWEAVMGSNPSFFDGLNNRWGDPVNPPFDRAALPVEHVSWDDLNNADGFLQRTGLSLPSEAQWEYACRAGTKGPIAGTGNLDDMGWHRGNSGRQIHPVGQKLPNQFGLFDMHGNVLEWCDQVRRSDPLSTTGSEKRLHWGTKGGSVDRVDEYLYPSLPGSRYGDAGFRPVVPTP